MKAWSSGLTEVHWMWNWVLHCSGYSSIRARGWVFSRPFSVLADGHTDLMSSLEG
jgi:hypothetical protein